MKEDIIPIPRSKSSIIFLSGKNTVFCGLLIPNKNLLISEYLDDEIVRYKDVRKTSIFFSKITTSKVDFGKIFNAVMQKFSLDKRFPLELYKFSGGNSLSIGKDKAKDILSYLDNALSLNISIKNLELSFSLLNRQILQKNLSSLQKTNLIDFDAIRNNLFSISGDYNLLGVIRNLISAKRNSTDSNSVYVIDKKTRKFSEIITNLYFVLFTYVYSDEIISDIKSNINSFVSEDMNSLGLKSNDEFFTIVSTAKNSNYRNALITGSIATAIIMYFVMKRDD